MPTYNLPNGRLIIRACWIYGVIQKNACPCKATPSTSSFLSMTIYNIHAFDPLLGYPGYHFAYNHTNIHSALILALLLYKSRDANGAPLPPSSPSPSRSPPARHHRRSAARPLARRRRRRQHHHGAVARSPPHRCVDR